jgi:hypothetical protein
MVEIYLIAPANVAYILETHRAKITWATAHRTQEAQGECLQHESLEMIAFRGARLVKSK